MSEIYHKNAKHTWRLFSQIQHYAWGTRNQQAYIPRLLGIPIEPDFPYAELWIGDNPKAPSTIVPHGTRGYKVENPVTLDQWIQSNPVEILGQNTFDRFGAQLPFLAKILSVGDSLSIQVHPNLEQARRLHALNSKYYPDSNHKPEMAIAIDRSEALAGFRPLDELKSVLEQYHEIAQMAESNILHEFLAASSRDCSEIFARYFRDLCLNALEFPEKLVHQVEKLAERLQHECLTRKLSVHEQLFLYLRQRYGSDDPGLLIIFLLNHVELRPGQALLIPTGMPHAYLQGNVFECQACSDNVVRAGLTPKHRDLKTLVDIVNFYLGQPQIYRPRSSRAHIVYPLVSPEFCAERVLLEENATMHFYHPESPYVLYFLEGNAEINYPIDGIRARENYRHSHCVFVPASFPPIEIRAQGDCLFIVCKVPSVEFASEEFLCP